MRAVCGVHRHRCTLGAPSIGRYHSGLGYAVGFGGRWLVGGGVVVGLGKGGLFKRTRGGCEGVGILGHAGCEADVAKPDGTACDNAASHGGGSKVHR